MKSRIFVDWIVKTIIMTMAIVVLVGCDPQESHENDSEEVTSSVVDTQESEIVDKEKVNEQEENGTISEEETATTEKSRDKNDPSSNEGSEN